MLLMHYHPCHTLPSTNIIVIICISFDAAIHYERLKARIKKIERIMKEEHNAKYLQFILLHSNKSSEVFEFLSTNILYFLSE